MSDFKSRKAIRIEEAKAGVTFQFSVVTNSYAWETETVGTFKSRQAANDFTAQISAWVGDCRALRALISRHPNAFISSGMSFKIVREKIAAA